jgi:hypothetical protein
LVTERSALVRTVLLSWAPLLALAGSGVALLTVTLLTCGLAVVAAGTV